MRRGRRTNPGDQFVPQRGGLNSKLHAVCDSHGRPRSLFLTASQVSDYSGAAALLATMPPAKVLLADWRYDADGLRDPLAGRRIEACIPSKSNRKIPILHDRVRYRKRHRIENRPSLPDSSPTGAGSRRLVIFFRVVRSSKSQLVLDCAINLGGQPLFN